MLKVFRLLYALLDRSERRSAVAVFALMLAVALGEVLGVASILPFLAVLANPELIRTNLQLAWLYQTGGFAQDRTFLIALGTAFFVLLVGSLLLKGLGIWAVLRFSHQRSLRWSLRLVSAYLRQPYSWFLNRNTGDLASSILAEVENVTNSALVPLMQSLAQGIVALMLLSLLVLVDPMLAGGAAILIGGGYAIVSALSRARLERFGEDRWRADRARYIAVQEAFGGIKDVKINGLEQQMLTRFRTPMSVRVDRVVAVLLLIQLPPLAMQAVLFGGMLLAILYLIVATGSFLTALPVLGLYALAGYRLMPALQRVFEEGAKVRNALPVVESLATSLVELENTAGLPHEELAFQSVPMPFAKCIELRDVTYTYPESDRRALNEVSLQIQAGASVGVVGSTGSGKTTLVDVVLGLLAPTNGTLSVDGETICASNVRAWQACIGYIPQSIFLADDSIAANIAFGIDANAIDMDAVVQAAKKARIHEFIEQSLPEGYLTQVGERGVRLSGGQRQRIGIARALYRVPALIVMDEATSALDNITESEVMEAIRSIEQDRTMIIIAHRLSTIRHCRNIFVMENGRLADQGDYDTLVERNAYFRQLTQAS